VLVGGLLALLLTAGWWFLLISPVNERVADAQDQLAAAENDELQLLAQRRTLQTVEDNMLEYLAALGDLEASIPPTPQTAALIDDLSVLADETGIDWRAGSYGQPQAIDSGVFEIPLAISVEGQFFEVLGYLYGMADLERLVRIDSLSISPAQDEQGFTILNVAISAKAYTSSDLGLPVTEEIPPPEDGAPGPEDGTPEPTEGEDVAIPTGARF
jgi:type IV pilus assembly protein PilO